MLLVLILLACPRTTATTPKSSGETVTSTLLSVETVSVQSGQSCRFNGGRQWVLSVHAGLDDGSLHDSLAAELEAAGLAGQVVYDRFGSELPERVEVVLGMDLPVELASAVVRLTDQATDASVVVSASEDQSDTCNRSRAYIGSLLPTDNPPTSVDVLEQLGKAHLSADEFWPLVPPSDR